jgi:hypothetical protein
MILALLRDVWILSWKNQVWVTAMLEPLRSYLALKLRCRKLDCWLTILIYDLSI